MLLHQSLHTCHCVGGRYCTDVDSESRVNDDAAVPSRNKVFKYMRTQAKYESSDVTFDAKSMTEAVLYNEA